MSEDGNPAGDATSAPAADMDYGKAELADAAEEEKRGLVLDFDEALREYRDAQQALEVTFAGKTYELPRTTPANFAMFYLRHCLTPREGGDGYTFEVPEDMFLEFLTLMFGAEFSKDVGESDVEMGFVMQKAVPMVLAAWGLQFIVEGKASGGATAEEIPDG